MREPWVKWLAGCVLVAGIAQPAAGDRCTEEERDERGQCPPKDAGPRRPPPVRKTELEIQGPDIEGARVLLDGKDAGHAPLILETTPGSHRIELHRAGSLPYAASVVAKQGVRVPVVVKLQPVPSAPVPAIVPAQGRCPEGMLHVPAAKFQRRTSDNAGDDRPPETVTIAGYCIDRTEVTMKAYAACEAAKGCAATPRTITDSDPEERKRQSWFCNQGDRPDHPVNCVHWEEAEAYCKWAGKRLPTPEEWVYAAQGQDDRAYPWGNDPPSERRLNACGTECVAMGKRVLQKSYAPLYKASDGWESTAPVGSFSGDTSPFGVLDMAGNVSEWTAPKNGLMAAVCGASWLDNRAAEVHVMRCSLIGARYRYNYMGFRCVRDE